MGQIRDSNGPMLAAMARAQGIEPRQTTHASDRLEAILAALQAAADWDIVILTGGVSVGTFDFVPQALAEYGAESVFHGVKQKPGKPLLLARKNRQLLFGLPGNPLACHLGFHRYISAAIGKLSGRPPRAQPDAGRIDRCAASSVGRPHLFPAWPGRVCRRSAPRFRVRLLPGVSSADIFHGCQANCYVELPSEAPTPSAGDACGFTWLE